MHSVTTQFCLVTPEDLRGRLLGMGQARQAQGNDDGRDCKDGP